jgi:hypothetical protein
MTLAELLAELEARDVRIEVIGGKLRVEAPPGAMPAWLQAAVLEHKLALLARESGAPAVEGQPAPLAPLSPPATSVRNETLDTLILPGGTIRIPLDDLVYGDFLERHRLRIVDGTAYPDGRTFRPTLYLAYDPG